MPRFNAPFAILSLVLAGCSGSVAGATDRLAASSAVERRPTVDLEVTGGPAAGTYPSDPAATLNVCAQASDGSWRVMYGGGSPWANVDMFIGPEAALPGHASDVALEISARTGYLWIDQAGTRGGDPKGRSEVSVEIMSMSDSITFVVAATTPSRTTGGDGALSEVALTVTCPI